MLFFLRLSRRGFNGGFCGFESIGEGRVSEFFVVVLGWFCFAMFGFFRKVAGCRYFVKVVSMVSGV